MTSGPSPSVHVLVVHGVGRHDHLSNLLRTYQSVRANVTSVEAPIAFEDLIPGWRLTKFEEGATPPFLRLEPRVPPQPGGVASVHFYEVNYSGFAGVIRLNHPIDLTRLFLGLDLAVCSARQRARSAATSVFGGGTGALAVHLQRVSGILIASTVPIIGLPSIVFRDYLGTFVGTFTRFFEDIATFALDKNGEQLISSHLDRSIDTITSAMNPGDRLVIAAHSLGSVVVHNYVVRSWAEKAGRTPDTLITFGSPIGLLGWMWLFLDFEDMEFARPIPKGDHYFCWNPAGNTNEVRSPLAWINVVNCLDPIATAFPDGAADLSATPAQIAAALEGGRIEQRFFGDDRTTLAGAAHSKYLNDRSGFLRILIRAAELQSGDPKDVPSRRSADSHWSDTRAALLRLQWILALAGAGAITAYCGIVAERFGEWRVIAFAVLFLWPAPTVGLLALYQRLMLGGPNKRIPPEQIRDLMWRDLASCPYRLREAVLGWFGTSRDVDPLESSPGSLIRLFANLLSFVPALGLMAIPVAGAIVLTGHWPASGEIWNSVFAWRGLIALVTFMVYVVCCAGFELVRTWRAVIATLRAMPAPDPSTP